MLLGGCAVIKNRLLTVLMCISTVILVISFSIAIPIYVRPFYYCQIESFDLVEKTGFDKEKIITAYDEVLDYLTKPNKDFGVGDFKYTEDGKSHFQDCKILFSINAAAFLLSLFLIILLSVFSNKKYFQFSRPFGKHFTFICGLITLTLFLLIGIFILFDFGQAFISFHNIFFFGKDNWVFNTTTDTIIKILPKEFFLNCAVFIVSCILVISSSLIIFGALKGKKKL